MGDRMTKEGLFKTWKGEEPSDGKGENKGKNQKKLKEEKELKKRKKKDEREQRKGKGQKEDRGTFLQGEASSTRQTDDTDSGPNNAEENKGKNQKKLEEKELQKGKKKDEREQRKGKGQKDDSGTFLQGGASSSGQIHDASLEQNNSEASSTRQTDDTDSGPNNAGNTANKKGKAPHSSNLYTVKKGKSQVSEQASDPVPDPAAWLQTYDSALSTLERTNTQPMPLPATETSDNKGGVPIETKGWNSLHSAAKGGNEGIIEILLSCGLDIDSRGNDGITPLMVAAAAGKEETVNFLLSKGADPHLKNYIGRNLLHAAAEGGNTSIVERMLSYGIDIDSRDDECNSATSLIIAAKGNNVEVMKYLLEKGANLSLTTGSTKRNALHIASQCGSVAAIEMLLSCGLSLDSRDGEGNMPLAHAAACGQIEAVNCLLEHGADPLLKGRDGWTFLHFAAQSGNVTIIDTMLSKGLDIDCRGETLGLTPLLVSLKFGKLEAAKHLLGKGANGSLKAKGEITALKLAVFSDSVAAIEMLLSHGLSIDSRDAEGNTPLAHAAACGQIEAVNCLLEHGADPLLKGRDRWSLLHFAAQSGNVTIIDTMLSKGLDIDSRGETLGLTPLWVSLKFGKLEAAKHLLGKGANEFLALAFAAASNSVAAIAMLLSHGLSINSRDAEGDTPLFYAARCGSTEALNYLVKQGADPLLQNNSEFGLLHLAALSNNVATIEAVLSKNFDVNIRTSSQGITPLFVSLFNGNLEAANYLLERGADEHLKSEEGWTVLSAAASGGNVAVIEMLLNRGHNANSRDGCDRTPVMYAAEKGNKAAVEYLLPLSHEGLLPTTD